MENLVCLFVCLIFSRSMFSLGPLSLHWYLNNSIKKKSLLLSMWSFGLSFSVKNTAYYVKEYWIDLRAVCGLFVCVLVVMLLGFFSLIIRVFLHSCRQLSVLQTSWIQGSSCSKVMWLSYWKWTVATASCFLVQVS